MIKNRSAQLSLFVLIPIVYHCIMPHNINWLKSTQIRKSKLFFYLFILIGAKKVMY